MGGFKFGLKGLSADTRSPEDKREIAQMAGDSIQPFDPNRFDLFPAESMVVRDTATYGDAQVFLDSYFSRLDDEMNEKAKKDAVYYSAIDRMRESTHSGLNVEGRYTTEIRDIASAVSPYYRRFKNTDRLTLDTPQWNELAAQYKARLEAYGEDAANQYLNLAIKDNVASNQPLWEKGYYMMSGLGADVVGSTVSTAGLVYGLVNATFGNYDKVEGLSGLGNFLNAVLDNDVTRLGNDIVTYGTFLNLDEARREGIPINEIMNTQKQQNQFLSINTPFEVIQQGGFTVASMLLGSAYSKIGNWAFKGMKGAALRNAAGNMSKAKTAISRIQKFENVNNKVVIPGLVGTTEGVVEGLQTKIGIEEEGYQAAYDAYNAAVRDKVNQQLAGYTRVDNQVGLPTYYDSEGKEVNLNAVYTAAQLSLKPKLDESLAQVDYAASKAGIGNFLVNSAINGMINTTFKAGLQSETVQNSLRNGKLTGWAYPKQKFKITGTAGNVKVKPRVSTLGMVWSYAKEPAGEFTGEYLQTLSDSFFSGYADANIHSFIDNKYNGNALVAVGEKFSDDWASAWTQLENSLTSKESMKAGVYGALSSMVGTPSVGRRTNRLNSEGRVMYKTDSEGNIKRDKNGNPITQKTYFGRGQSADGDLESRWEAFQRWVPWRSGLTANVREVRRRNDAASEQAHALEEWLNDPKNRGKFDGLTGTMSWVREVNESGMVGDEYNYRNSSLGKAVSDIFMLQNTEGSDFYNSVMQQLTDVAYMEQGSDDAAQYIQAMRDNVNVDTDSMSDEQIFEMIQGNAQRTLELMSQVKQESDNIEKLLGDIDEDTKQSLVFAQLSISDWEKRSKQLNEELSAISVPNSVGHSTELSEGQKAIIAKYGSLDKAVAAQHKLQQIIKGLEESIANLEKRKSNLTKQEKAKLKQLKVNKSSLTKQLNQLTELSTIPEGVSTVLNEEEIMALDPVTRSMMILQGKSQLYGKLYQSTGEQDKVESSQETTPYSPEQQAVIDHLVEQGMAKDRDFLAKIVDAGRIQSATTRFLSQYNAVLLDQRGYKAYSTMVKQQAADELTRQRAESIGQIQDYAEFASALDNALETSDMRARRVLLRSLKDNPNYQKYEAQRETIDRLMRAIGSNEKFRDLDGNSADLFMGATLYMYERGVDLNDSNAVWNALTETDDNGYNKFVSYLNKQNEGVDDGDKVVFTSLEEVYQTYKDVWTQADLDRQTQERASRQIEPDPTTQQPSPVAPPIPQNEGEGGTQQGSARPGIFAKASSTAEGSFTEQEKAGQPIEVEQGGSQTANPLQQSLQDQAKETPENGNRESPVDAMLQAVQGSTNYSQEVRNKAEASINEVKGQFDNVDDIQKALLEKAAQLESTDDENSILAASLLRRATTISQPKQQQRPSIFSRRNKQSKLERVYPNPNPKGAFISSMDIAYARQQYPDSPTVKFYDDHHIERFLSEGTITGDTPVYFLTDEAFTSEIERYNQEHGTTYGPDQLPVIAVVEDANGQYEIGGKKYQPIGIMPANNVSWSYGSAHMPRIRNLAKSSGVSLIEYEGKPLETRPHGKGGGIKAKPRDENNRQNTGIQTLIETDLTPAEREELAGQDKKTRRSNPIYQAAKRRFLKHLGVGTLPNGHKMVAYMQPNMKDGRENPIFVFASPVESTTGRDTDRTLPEAIVDGTIDDVVNFNSRTKGVFRAIENFLNSMPSTQNADGDVISQITGSASSLEKAINRYLYLSPRSGFRYSITPISGPEGIVNGERQFNLELVNEETGEKVQLTSFTKNSDAKVVAKDVIAHLLMNGGSLRTVEGKPIVSWQVDYQEIENGSKEAANNMSDWVDDGIIELPATSLQYDIRTIELETPFKGDGTLRFVSETNPDNATSPTPINDPVVGVEQANTNGAIVDGDSGAVLDGKVQQPTNEAVKVAQEKVQAITEDSKLFELSEDGKFYVNTKTGKVYTRVTSILSADVTASERFDQNSAWALPSTNIGTSVDEFVRDFFAGTLKVESFNYARASYNGYEVSSQGDKRFSALNAAFKQGTIIEGQDVGGKTIEWVYQNVIKKSRKGQAPAPDSILHNPSLKTKDAQEDFSYERGYLPLWREWARQNPELMEDLRKKAVGKVLTDKFASTKVSQARALAQILTEENRYQYPNASQKQWEAFRKQLEGVKLQMEAMGFHIVPRDIVAAGTLGIADDQGKTYNIDVAGTLDLLAYDDQGNFYIFDMKTVRNPKSIDSKKHKWSQQTSLYQKFLENAYGIKIKNRYVIPIQVSYPDPRNVTYTQGEGTQVLVEGQAFENASPNLMHTVQLDYYEPTINYGKLTDQERELAQGIAQVAKDGGTITSDPMQGNPTEATVLQTDEPYIDPITGLAMDPESGNDIFGGLWNDPMLEGSNPDTNPMSSIMPAEMRWENLTDEQRSTLEHLGFTQEFYNKVNTQEEIDHMKECLGF